MAKYVCNTTCVYLGNHYRVGEIVFFDSTPSAYFDLSESTDLLVKAGPGEIDKDGTFYFPSPGWDDLRFPSAGINPPGAAADPTRDTTTGLLVFAKDATNTIAGVAQMPHAWLLGSAIEPHVHVKYTDGDAGDSIWKFEYDMAGVNADFAGSYTSDQQTFASPANADKHQLHDFGAIDMAGYGISTCILWKLSRLGGEVADDYDDTISLIEFDIHYQVDSPGSGREYYK